MALANVALTDTFDYWRTITNSMVVAINDKLVFCNTSNANTVSIPSFVSRSSNLYVNIITSTSYNDTATSNVASAFTANSVHGAALSYVQAANNNAAASFYSTNTYLYVVTTQNAIGANNWANTVGVAGNNYASILAANNAAAGNNYASILVANNAVGANNWANTKLSNTSGMSFAGSLYVPGNLGIGSTSPQQKLEVVGLINSTDSSGYNRSYIGWKSGSTYGYSGLHLINVDNSGLIFGTNNQVRGYIDTNGNFGIGTGSPAATLDVVGTVSIAKASVLSQTLTDATTISWDTSLGQVAYITLGGNRTMAAPTNLKVGTYILHVIQDGSGNRTITWNSVFKWPAGVAPVLTSTAGRRDLFSFVCDGTNLYGSYLPDVR